MKAILCFLAFILWLIATLLLVASIVGLFLVLINDHYYFSIGKDLVQGFKGGDK
jgi:hypothetical protein